MKPLHSYSRAKFLALSPDSQIKTLNKLALALDEVLNDRERLLQLIAQLKDCLGWMDGSAPQNAVQLCLELDSASEPRQLSESLARYKASLGLNLKDTQLVLHQSDGPRPADPRLLSRSRQVLVILDNLRSAFNVGSIFRTAECLGLQAVWLCGVTPVPANPALAKTARGTCEHVDWRHFDATEEAIAQARSEGYQVCALETSPEAVSLYQSAFELPLAILVGNESWGISPGILALCDSIIALPNLGWKNSLNVAVALSVGAYHIVCASQVPA